MVRFIFFMLLVLPFENFAQDINNLLKEAQQQELVFKENEAFSKYTEVLRLQPANMTALCKSSELCSRIGARQKDKSRKTDYYKAARTYASAALRVNPNSSEANFVMAFALGRLTLISTGKERVGAVKDIKYYADNAIRADPNNFKAYHVLGKWNYEVSDLNFAERSLAKWLYGGLPRATLQDAIYNYEKSRALNPSFVLNYLELAKAYYINNEKMKAINLLNLMMPMPTGMLDDTRIKEEGKHLLTEWR